MGLRIQTNLPSISAQRVLDSQQRRLEHSSQALASGSRIVHAGDDAAGLAISERLRGQIRGIAMARQNAYNATSSVQIAEGGLNEISNIMIRLRELGIQSASDTIGDQERKFIEYESQHLIEESNRIALTTQYGSRKLLDGSSGKQTFHVGPFGSKENTITYNSSTDATTSELGVDGISMSDRDSARDSLKTLDDAMEKLGVMRANFGAIQSRLSSTVSNLDNQYENLSAANSRIRDVDVAHESSEMASASVLQNAAVSVLAQANAFPQVAMKLL
jgi:flagellin